MKDFFTDLFNTTNWPPRWYCGNWSDFDGWLYITSDLLIWLAYSAIPFVLIYFMIKRRHDMPFLRVFWLFILFILTCGATHLMDAVLFWNPAYRFQGLLLALTAAVSWVAVIGLIKVLPKALTLRTPRQLEATVEQRTAELSLATRNLELQNDQLRTFTDITSHNLRSPVSNMISLINLYKEEGDAQTKDMYIEKMQRVSAGLMNTLDQLYEVARLRDQDELVLERITFEPVLVSLLEQITELANEANVTVTYDFSGCQEVEYNRPYLENIMLNLITNAIKYRHPDRKPTIHVYSDVAGDQPRLHVQDNGLGIDLDKYGDKLFKLHKTFHGNADARGAGLFMVRSQVERMGGKIDVESNVDVGTKFCVTFK